MFILTTITLWSSYPRYDADAGKEDSNDPANMFSNGVVCKEQIR